MTEKAPPHELELWGGIECSIVRIRKGWRDQITETGHLHRDEDLDLIASLGIRTLRYPVLWEKVAPSSSETDFTWHDRRMAQMRRLGIKPVLGLLHHGSGPAYTSLMDRQFPALFAAYAKKVAQRYPDVTDFTPINEPLTTARFSGLYGHWYPHQRSMRAFARMMINQCRAIVDAMQAIREVTPHANLIQTEDLGRIFSGPVLAYQAEHENQRRWLTFDLLHGLVDRHHPWFGILRRHGIEEAELLQFLDAPCLPDIIGINHYLTSDRFLENRHEAIPPGAGRGGNGRHRYADLEAVRVRLEPEATGPKARLREAWLRYQRPLAVTECHHGATRDEQLRWLNEVWNAAKELKAEGADIRAVTVWALMGLVDWNSLLLLNNQHYEPGAYDIRSPQPRLTAIGRATRELAHTGSFDHPVLDVPGWWRREERFYLRPSSPTPSDEMRALFILSAGGLFARRLFAVLRHRGLRNVTLPVSGSDRRKLAAFEARIKEERPWAVIVDGTGADGAMAGLAEPSLAAACAEAGTRFVSVSTACMFAPNPGQGWTEAEPPNLGTGSATNRRQVEEQVLKADPHALVVRTTRIFDDAGDEFGLGDSGGDAADSQAGSTGLTAPTYAPDLAHALLDLLIDQEKGLWHLTNPAPTSGDELRELLLASGIGMPGRSGPACSGASAGFTALASARGAIMPSLRNALSRYEPSTGKTTLKYAPASAEEMDGALA